MAKGVTWDDVRRERTESREYTITATQVGPGRRAMVVRCPWCDRRLTVFGWSLAGTGKRCDCGALLGGLDRRRAHRLLERFRP